MNPSNAAIAEFFFRMAELLEIEEPGSFRARAYGRAAVVIRALPQNLAEMVGAGEDLEPLPAIGADFARKIREICETGRLRALDEARRRVPVQLVALSAVPGIGPRRLRRMREELGIGSIADLRKAAKAGRLSRLPGFGPALESRLLAATSARARPPA